MALWKIQIPHYIIKDRNLSNHAFYLLVMLVNHDRYKNNSAIVYNSELMEELFWKNNRTLKKYLKELKKNKYIDYDFDDLPLNRALKINLTYTLEKFTQVDIDTIKKIAAYGQFVKVIEKKKMKDTNINIVEEKTYDMKEASVRLFYLYETYYNAKANEAFPGYKKIVSEIPISPRHIKSINNMFHDNDIVEVTIGKRHNYDSKRSHNSYIPICERTES